MPMLHGGLAKLTEEIGELSQVIGKRLQYPKTDIHPDGKHIAIRLEEEIGDVMAAIKFVIDKHHLEPRAIAIRSSEKLALFQKWDREET